MKILSTVLPVSLLAFSCYAQDIRYNYDKDADFSKYKTYKWVEISGAKSPDQLTDEDIKKAVDSVLATKGLTKTDSDDASLLVGYQLAVSKETQLTSYGSPGWGYGPGWGRGWYGGGGGITTATTSSINIGTLDLDMYDPARKQLVWRGTATKTLNPPKDPDKRRNNIQKAMTKLLKDYPPKPKT
jgi:hypothetical protein